MENQTSVKYFYIISFSDNTKSKTFISCLFFLIYLVGVLVNSSVITVVSLDPHLHHPMYLFICNLSFVDILYTTVTVPKFLYILLSGDNIVSFVQCYIQICFYCIAAVTEEILLFIMAYDRYVAICLPLHYHRILSKRNCALMITGLWVTSCLNGLLFTISVLNMSTCHSNIIHQFFCDLKSITKISCTSSGPLYIIMALEILLFGVGTVSCTFISYINIFLVILSIESNYGRKKVFSTCSSHLSIITMYYLSALLTFLLPSYSDVMDFLFTALYTTVIPMLNPVIYSLQNSGVKKALSKILWKNPIDHNKSFSCLSFWEICYVTIAKMQIKKTVSMG